MLNTRENTQFRGRLRRKCSASWPTEGAQLWCFVVIDGMTSYEITLCASAQSLTVSVVEDACLGPGGVVWDAAVVLAEAIVGLAAEKGGKLTGLSAIELGAGVGLPGLTFAALGGHCTLTDKPNFVGIQQRNAELNGLSVGNDGCAVKIVPFFFGGARKKLGKRRTYDYVLCSDILGCGDAGAYPELVRWRRCMAAALKVRFTPLLPRRSNHYTSFATTVQRYG